ncbi:MAG TPA: trypsin-like peptidase domain-containing protein [Syntrophorhabdaceae bacterium]|nr:trypsin-like peptidase domain-containing protein [Syntrophorhabdaceae bacterium]
MKNILLSIIISAFMFTSVYAETVDEMSKTVVFLRQQVPKKETIDGKSAEIFYRPSGTEEFKPMLETNFGTGFVIKHHNRDYLVTAKHVAEKMTQSGEIVINLRNEKSTAVTFQSLTDEKSAMPGARWFHHPKADISVHPIRYPANNDVISISENMFQDDKGEVRLLNSAYIVGFPMGLGVLDKLNPVAKEAKLASKLTSVTHPSVRKDLHFYFLDQALSEGYSGAPVFYMEDVMFANAGAPIKISEKAHLLGLQSSAFSDKSGGKISLVVPISYVYEIFESSDFKSYEKTPVKKR